MRGVDYGDRLDYCGTTMMMVPASSSAPPHWLLLVLRLPLLVVTAIISYHGIHITVTLLVCLSEGSGCAAKAWPLWTLRLNGSNPSDRGFLSCGTIPAARGRSCDNDLRV